MKLFKKAKKGFTLVELVVVIAVIAILAAVSVGAYFGVTESANKSAAQQEGKAIHTNILLIGNDPAQSDIAVFTSEGLTVEDETKFKTALQDAVGNGSVYTITYDGVAVTTGFPAIVFGDISGNALVADQTGDGHGVYTGFTYYKSKGYAATFDIVSGAQK